MKEVSFRIIWTFTFLVFSLNISSQSCDQCNLTGRWHRLASYIDDDGRRINFNTSTINSVNENANLILDLLEDSPNQLNIDTRATYIFLENCEVSLNGASSFTYEITENDSDCTNVAINYSLVFSLQIRNFSRHLFLLTSFVGDTEFYVNLGDTSGSIGGSGISSNETDCNELECPSIEVNFDLIETEDDKTVQFVNQSVGASIPNWDFGDGSSNSNLSPKYAYQESGNYNICLTMSNICSDSESQCSNITLDFTSPTSEIIETNFTVYPIPTKEELIVESAAPSPLEAEIYNLQGILMMNMTLINGANLIDVYALPSGSYFIKTIEGSTKFIKE